MSGEPVSVNVEILDKEYVVACPEDEREALLESARLLNERMQQVRDGGKVLGTERVAVITALNLLHELSQQHREREQNSLALAQGINRLYDKVRAAVGRRQEIGAID